MRGLVHVAFLQLHAVAEIRKRRFDLVGVGSAHDRLSVWRQLAAFTDHIFDLGDAEARYRGKDVRSAECDAAGVVLCRVETRRREAG